MDYQQNSIIMTINIKGYKTYIVGTGFIMFGAGGFVAGKLDATAAIEAILFGLGLMGLRNAIPKKVTSA